MPDNEILKKPYVFLSKAYEEWEAKENCPKPLLVGSWPQQAFHAGAYAERTRLLDAAIDIIEQREEAWGGVGIGGQDAESNLILKELGNIKRKLKALKGEVKK